jgi:hypothetical protein
LLATLSVAFAGGLIVSARGFVLLGLLGFFAMMPLP